MADSLNYLGCPDQLVLTVDVDAGNVRTLLERQEGEVPPEVVMGGSIQWQNLNAHSWALCEVQEVRELAAHHLFAAHRAAEEFAAESSAPALARHHARAAATAWELPPDVVDSVELAVSELVTNALQHASRPARPGAPSPAIGLTMRQTDTLLRLEVTDGDATPPRFADVDMDAEDGRGLLIVAALAKQWGFAHLVGGGKTVWAELACG